MGGRRHGARVARAARRRSPPYRPDETKKKLSRSIPPPQAVDHPLTILSREERKNSEHSETS
jgi:hypothetical protein